ncbi:MAG: hypothetical protein LBP59_14860 [Planctomycetaceae bacterium]|jgi:hypothetical protein|nr:hypothetical protein [Planctomycetaceae bacterium]
MSEVYISSAFLFALRQSAGETPAIRWSRLLFRIAGGMPAFQDRWYFACDPSVSPAILQTIFCNKKLLSSFLKNYSLSPTPYPLLPNPLLPISYSLKPKILCLKFPRTVTNF